LVPCNIGCKTCDNTAICTSCPSGFYLETDNTCIACDFNCSECETSSDNCTTCSDVSRSEPPTCECANGYYDNEATGGCL